MSEGVTRRIWKMLKVVLCGCLGAGQQCKAQLGFQWSWMTWGLKDQSMTIVNFQVNLIALCPKLEFNRFRIQFSFFNFSFQPKSTIHSDRDTTYVGSFIACGDALENTKKENSIFLKCGYIKGRPIYGFETAERHHRLK